MVGQITGKMFDHLIEKDCASDLSGPTTCRIGPVREVAGPENAAIQNLAAMQSIGVSLAAAVINMNKKLQLIDEKPDWLDLVAITKRH